MWMLSRPRFYAAVLNVNVVTPLKDPEGYDIVGLCLTPPGGQGGYMNVLVSCFPFFLFSLVPSQSRHESLAFATERGVCDPGAKTLTRL